MNPVHTIPTLAIPGQKHYKKPLTGNSDPKLSVQALDYLGKEVEGLHIVSPP